MKRFIIGVLAFMCVWFFGAALGIHPTIAEGLLVVFAYAASELARELIP